MKKFLLNIVQFIPYTIVFYVLALFVLGNWAPLRFVPNLNYSIGANGHMFSRLDEVKHVNDIDILFLGSSHAYRGFDVRIFAKNGIKSFNLGSSAQTPLQTNLLLDRYLCGLNPKLVIYEVYPTTFAIDGVESSLDIIANDKNDMLSYEMAFHVNHIKTYNTLLYATIRDMLNLNSSFVEPTIKGDDTYIAGGYVEKRMSNYSLIKPFESEIVVNHNQLESFQEIVNDLKSKNIDIISVYAPITKSLYSSYTNRSYFDSIMNSYVEYYNFNDLMDLDDSLHFYDAHHLNQNGAELFSSKLLDVLQKR